MELLLLIIIVAAIVSFIKYLINNAKDSKPIEPPSTNIYVLGCNGDCGYFIPDFEAGDRMVYCKYQKKTVRQGSKCPFLSTPDVLRKGSFDD